MHQDLYSSRLAWIGVFLLVVFTALAMRFYVVQITRHDELYEKAREKYTATSTQLGKRGQIYDRNGSLLAGNLACRDIFAEPKLFGKSPGPGMVAGYLARRLGVPREVLAAKFAAAIQSDRPHPEVVVSRGIEIKRAGEIEADLRKMRIHGIRFADTTRRYYPKDTLLANLLGFTTNEGHGDAGIEKLFDGRLLPARGEKTFEQDRKGNLIPETESEISKARNGVNLYLTIQEPLQQIVESELKVMVEHHQPKVAYAVMADPRTGAILAMAQYPTFNPNDRRNMDPECWQNKILTHGFEPGSIMKSTVVAGALDMGLITLNKTYFCENGLWVYANRTLRDSGHRYGTLTASEIIQKSSNIGTAKIAVDMGKERVAEVLTRFGFGKPTGLGFPEEAPGIFRPVRKWDGLSVTRMPIGQGILVTPLQMVQAYCVMANRGVMPQLHILDRIEDPETGRAERPDYPSRGRVIKEEAAELITQAMKRVTKEGGTAPKAAVAGFEVAGKTGTAQKVENGNYGNKYVSSFIGYVPADNPAFVLIVSADEPTRNGYYGGTVAAPVFSRIAEKALKFMLIPQEGQPGATSGGSGPPPAAGSYYEPEPDMGDFTSDDAPTSPVP